MGYWGYKPYVPVAKRREKVLKAANKAKKQGVNYAPVEPYSGAIAKTFWGKAWCSNLERYSDFANRMPRGRSYVRSGAVIDLKISPGQVQALVVGSSLYQVSVSVKAIPQTQWQAVCNDCASSVSSLIELLQGKLSKSVMERICQPTTGLFPEVRDIQFNCSCPDSAGMCKHVAAALYGVGARLDRQPDLLFTLRHVDAKDLVAQASITKPQTAPSKSKKILDSSDDLADVFGLEMAQPLVKSSHSPKASPKPSKTKSPPKKTAIKPTAKKVAPVKTTKKAPSKTLQSASPKKPSTAPAKTPTKRSK